MLRAAPISKQPSAEKRVLVRTLDSSYTTSETVHSDKGISGGLLLAMVLFALLATVVAVVAFSANSARAGATLPPNFARSQLVGGLASPTAMEFAPDGRLFVAEQRGTLRVLKAGGKLATFLDISGRVDSAGERGLLGIAFDPAFSKTATSISTTRRGPHPPPQPTTG